MRKIKTLQDVHNYLPERVSEDATEKIHFLEEGLRLMRSFHLTSNEIEKLIDRYAMRPQILRSEFNCFLERKNAQ